MINSRRIKISPSIFAANFLNIEKEIKRLERLNVDYIHYDIMDYNFVPNISFGPLIIEQITRNTSIKGDIHLMINLTMEKVSRFFLPNIEFITVHLEAPGFCFEVLKFIKENGYKVGISLRPKTKVETVIPYINYIDMILIMTVEPGFSGQNLIPETIDKIKEARYLIDRVDKRIDLEVDGGINSNYIEKVIEAGANIIVSGSYFFENNNCKKVIELIKKYNIF